MATVLSHPAVPIGLAAMLGPAKVPGRLVLLAMACSILPDADVLGWGAGIPYGHLFGHRGFSHSLPFALLTAALATLFSRRLGASPMVVFLLISLSTVSHGILDAMTTGGLGVAFFSPFSNHRYFFPWRVIRVAPIGIIDFFTARGWVVLQSELIYVWLPCLAAGMAGVFARWGRWK